MKKPRVPVLVVVTCLFAAFTLGLYLGRSRGSDPVLIRTLPDPTAASTAGPPAEKPVYPININTADSETLQLLPGIGPVLAQRIMTYREERGPFDSPGALGLVDGIGEVRLEEIWDLITVGG